MGIYFWVAILLLLIGHLCKVYRWKQLIAMYEKADTTSLIRAMVLGQGINLVIPWRVGDLVRVYISGRRLKNGYALSLATVFADLYMDTLTVGMAFLLLYGLGIHKQEIAGITGGYILLSVVVIVLTVLVFACKRYIKKLIRFMASVFNPTIELGILYTTFATFSSLKNIFKKVNFGRIVGLTGLMWGSYFGSYEMFARFMQELGYNLTLTGVFKTLFSFSGISLFRESFLYLGYLLIPLCILGVYAFACKPKMQKSQYYHLLPQLNQNEKLAFLEIYFGNEERKDYFDLYLDINKDISVIQDYSAGSNATTMLCMDENKTFFRKYAFSKDALKLREQIDWLETYKNVLPVTCILKKHWGDNYCYYDMEYKPETVGFFQYIHTMPLEKSWCVLQEVLEALRCNIHNQTYAVADRETVQKYVEVKVTGNIDICLNKGGKWLRGLAEYDVICINGVDYPNLHHYEAMLQNTNLCNRFISEKYSVIHGDLTIENIICMQNGTNGWYLIDPNTGSLHESAFLDYAKLLQSLHGGYEFLMMAKEVNIHDNAINFLYTKSSAYNRLYKKYQEYLREHFSSQEVINIYLHEAIHWLRLMPYKIKKDSRKAVIFYAGMLMVLHDIEQMILEEQGDVDEKVGTV